MTASTSSRRGLWLAFGGLAIVPFLGVILVLTMGEDRDERRSRPSRSSAFSETGDDPGGHEPRAARDEEPAVAANETDPAEPENTEEDDPEVAEDPGPAPTPDDPASAPSEGVGTLLEESREIENTDPARSRQLLRDVLAIDPDNIVALDRLSTKMLIDERHAEAKHLADHCDELGGPASCQKVAKLAVEQSPNVEKLAGAVKGCLAETPENIGCLAGMVNYHLIKGQVSDAAVYAGRLTQEAPQSEHTIFARARIKAASKEYREARQLFRWACDQGHQEACFRVEALDAEGW